MNNKLKRIHSNFSDDTKCSPAKRQFRNENEKRRRDLFSQLIANLENSLNINKISPSDEQTAGPSTQTNRLDKASILHEAAIFLRQNQQNLTIDTKTSSSIDRLNDIVDFSWKPQSTLVTLEEWIQIAIQSMNCFFLVAKPDPHTGQIVYVSNNISSLLDYSQSELLNRSLFELIAPRDHDRLRDYILKDHKVLETCDLSWRRATAEKYERCTFIGAFRQVKSENDEKYLMAIVKVNTLDKSLLINNESCSNDFTTRLNLQGRFTHIDSKTREFLGYSAYELIGHTYFDFVHPEDLPIIVQAHKLWKQNGNGKSDPYRFLSKGQQWIFIQTQCQVQLNSWTGKPESYICTTNCVINPNECLQKQPLNTTTSPQLDLSIIESNLTTDIPLKVSPSRSGSSDTQIRTFLTRLGNETYRTNIEEKLNVRRKRKQAEIRVREEEIKVIEDLIKFVTEFPTKTLTQISSKSESSPITTSDRTSQSNQLIQEDLFNRLNALQTRNDPTLLRSPSIIATEDLSPRSSPRTSRNLLSNDSHHILSPKDDSNIDGSVYKLFSPQHSVYGISSPVTPFSIPSRLSPMIPEPLSVSPSPAEPFPRSVSPANNSSLMQESNNPAPPQSSVPSSPPPSSSSSSSSSSSTTLSSPSLTSNKNILPSEQSTKKCSFNRSLPHSLVS